MTAPATAPTRWFTDQQVAAMCGVTVVAVRKWVLRGHVRRGSGRRIDGRSLLDYLDNRGARGQHTDHER